MTYLTKKEVRWCWKNDIYISPIALDSYGKRLVIEVVTRGKREPGKEVFDNKSVHIRIEKLYTIIYERNNKN